MTVLENAQALAPAIAARAAEAEANRRVPADLLAELVQAGCFRTLLPKSHGGTASDVPTALRMFEILAAADASTSWVVMIGGCAWADLVHLPRATFDAVFADPDAITAGAFNPSGVVAPADGGYRVSGRWGFASGCEHATWIFGNGIEGVVDGIPQLRTGLFTPEEVVIEDTWTASGLCGTGSHHFHVHDLVVPAERTCVPLTGEPCIDEPIVRFPVPSLLALAIAAVAVGIATGALDDVLAVAAGKQPLLAATPMAANPVFHRDLATADTDLRAARALLAETAEEAWSTAELGEPFTPTLLARARAAATWVTERATAIVDAAAWSAGSNAVYADSLLQRRQRDIHTLGQHFLVRPDTMMTAGALLAGQPLTVPVF